MSVRTFIFCDKCNPQAIRTLNPRCNVNDRRETEARHNDNVRRQYDGRRNSDGRAWFEGSLETGIKAGWATNELGDLLCPNCKDKKSITNNTQATTE